MRVFALILAACAASTLNWTQPGHCAAAPMKSNVEERLPHISVEALGNGDPIVLVPGLSSPRAVWDGIAPKLARHHRLLLVQVNGFAGDAPGANLNPGVLDGISDDLAGYIASHHLGRVRIIGHSMGGLVALKFAKAHPDQVDRLMIVDALPFFAVLMDPSATVETVRPTAEAMRTRIASTYGRVPDPATVEANVKSLALKPESIARMKQWAAASDPRVIAEALYEDLTTDVRADLPRIGVPVTIIVPWSDQGFGEEKTLAFYKRQYSALPNVAFVGIANAGHFAMLDQAQAFEAAVDQFVK